MTRFLKLVAVLGVLAVPPALQAQGIPTLSGLDTDGNGTLSLDEVKPWYSMISQFVPSQSAKAFLKAIDTNGDGVIDQKEFDALPKAPPGR